MDPSRRKTYADPDYFHCRHLHLPRSQVVTRNGDIRTEIVIFSPIARSKLCIQGPNGSIPTENVCRALTITLCRHHGMPQPRHSRQKLRRNLRNCQNHLHRLPSALPPRPRPTHHDGRHTPCPAPHCPDQGMVTRDGNGVSEILKMLLQHWQSVLLLQSRSIHYDGRCRPNLQRSISLIVLCPDHRIVTRNGDGLSEVVESIPITCGEFCLLNPG